MPTSRPKGSKVIKVKASNKTTKNRLLARHVARLWSARMPRKASMAIWPLVLSSVSSCLASDMPYGYDEAIQKIASTGDLKAIVDMRSQFGSPQKYGSASSYFATQVVLNLLAKTKLPVKGLNPLEKAYDRFQEAEKLCRITNRRLIHYRAFDHARRPLNERHNVHEVFHLARRKIQAWLGPLNVDYVLSRGRHGPGGVVGLKRPYTTPYFKLSNSEMSCSTGAYWYALKTVASNDAWVRALAESEDLIGKSGTDGDFWSSSISCIPYETRLRLVDKNITIADYNEVTFVDKDALTKRSISIEPQLNVYLQLSIGEFLKERLRMAGCDLSDQTRNKGLAYVGSVQHDLEDPVTLDLRMASDCLSTELVRELLPCEWFDLLDNVRSRYGKYRGESFEWSKFSSMGNGFTFELESMVFYALAQSCSDLSGTTEWFQDTFGPAYKYAYVSVFGDDIIVPKKVANHLIHILRYCGFQLNLDKSFVDGPFRESCGSDFWEGTDVRTFYLKRDLSRARDLIHLHNGLKKMNGMLNGRLAPTLELIRTLIPIDLERHLRGSEPTLTDAYIWCEPDEVMSSALVVWNIHWQRWTLPVMRVSALQGKGSQHWRYAQFLYANTSTGVLNGQEGPLGSDLDQPNHDLWTRHLMGGGSRGEVVLSGEGKSVIGWS